MKNSLYHFWSFLEKSCVLGTDSPEERRRRVTLVVITGLCIIASIVWGTLYYGIFGPTTTTFITYGFTVVLGVTLLIYFITKGFTFFPDRISYSSWTMLYHDIKRILNGYLITVTVTAFGTALSLLVTAMMAYPLSVSTLKYRNVLAFFAFFTMIFYGGMVPWYIIVSKVLRLRNTIFALIFPYFHQFVL